MLGDGTSPTRVSRDQRGRLHHLRGPALGYPDGWGVYAIHGVRVCPGRWIEIPSAVTALQVVDEPNFEVRRVMIKRMNVQRFVGKLRARPVAHDEYGTLYRIDWSGDEPLTLVEVVNGTPEPGTRKHYFLQVPPTMRRAPEAVAWTYDVPANEYAPEVRT